MCGTIKSFTVTIATASIYESISPSSSTKGQKTIDFQF